MLWCLSLYSLKSNELSHCYSFSHQFIISHKFWTIYCEFFLCFWFVKPSFFAKVTKENFSSGIVDIPKSIEFVTGRWRKLAKEKSCISNTLACKKFVFTFVLMWLFWFIFLVCKMCFWLMFLLFSTIFYYYKLSWCAYSDLLSKNLKMNLNVMLFISFYLLMKNSEIKIPIWLGFHIYKAFAQALNSCIIISFHGKEKCIFRYC